LLTKTWIQRILPPPFFARDRAASSDYNDIRLVHMPPGGLFGIIHYARITRRRSNGVSVTVLKHANKQQLSVTTQ